MSQDLKSLSQLRDDIDSIDEQLHTLLNHRAACAQHVAEVKQTETSDGEAILFYRPERETAVLRKVMQRNTGPLSNEEVARLFREIMSACLALELPMEIAFLGPEGTFTQAAALKHFGHSVNTVSFSTIDEVFREVDAGSCHYGVVPVENSTEGVISHTLDMFIESPLKICGEVSLRIHHYLMSKMDDLSSINKVYSHRQSFAQCREWLDRQLPNAERVAVNSNSEAAKLAAAEKATAAIGSNAAAEIYQLSIIAENIEDEPDNTTRFIILGKQDVETSCTKMKESTCFDKTSILFTTANKPGALQRLLKPIADNGLSMTRIESRPSRSGLWQYLFFVDIDGHISQSAVKKALQEIDKEANMLKILGSYPKAVM